jgi:uncharacterized cupredoxin-like copper-binding protein
MHILRTFVLATGLFALAACGGAGGESAAESEPPAADGSEAAAEDGSEAAAEDGSEAAAEDDMEGHHGAAFAFGRPAGAADADRTIEIRTANQLVFDPDEITVAKDETVTFSISNDGDLPHDFVIGDEAAQQEHAEEMAETAETNGTTMEESEHDDANAVTVPPGQTVELTWVFDGEVAGLLYGCHVPGHYEAGMAGHITLEG